jgi:hypothetical protein
MTESRKDFELQRALADAENAYRGAMADYDAGLFDEAALQAALFRAGMVFDLHDLWLLEPQRRAWWRYDGIRLESTDVALSETDDA